MDEVTSNGEPQMTFDIATNGAATVVTLRGELDIANVDTLEAAVTPVIDGRPGQLVVDVGGLRFADSSAIALWVRWAARVGEIEFRDASPLLRRVITSMGLEGRFRLTP
jgi:anti-anti-sigma factor